VFLKSKVVIVGAGVSGLFAAYKLLEAGIGVDLYDHSSGVGKKFLVAGKGGLNLTHSEERDEFIKNYEGHEELFSSLISEFSPDDLISFCKGLSVETFVGSSGRVFPKELTAAHMLRNWLDALRQYSNFNLFLNHRLVSLQKVDEAFNLDFLSLESKKEISISSNIVVMGLGGKSWKKTGSDGSWVKLINRLGLEISPFLSMNCGYEAKWPDSLKAMLDHDPLKNVSIFGKKGELMLTPFGVEGGLIYAFSKKIQKEIIDNGEFALEIDLRPDSSFDELKNSLSNKRLKDSRGNQLRKSLKLTKVESLLLKETLSKEHYFSDEKVACSLKSFKITLFKARPIDEAISSSGGIKFSEVSDSLESKKHLGLYFMGEMLDWDAPTGGYLFQGCFSSAYRVVKSILS
tara:strand:- start:136 stop:1344 length:1209 start_codon:yes stop_codon:yes gene_type:complete